MESMTTTHGLTVPDTVPWAPNSGNRFQLPLVPLIGTSCHTKEPTLLVDWLQSRKLSPISKANKYKCCDTRNCFPWPDNLHAGMPGDGKPYFPLTINKTALTTSLMIDLYHRRQPAPRIGVAVELRSISVCERPE